MQAGLLFATTATASAEKLFGNQDFHHNVSISNLPYLLKFKNCVLIFNRLTGSVVIC